MVLKFIIFLVFLPFLLVRLLRWLALVQQKEYRLDRLALFLKSTEGKLELLKVILKPQDFSRTGLKRPKITARVLLVAVLTIGLLSGLIVLTSKLSLVIFVVSLIMLYLLLPLLTFLGVLPTVLVSLCATYYEIYQAQQKIIKTQPLIIGITGSYGKTTTKLILAHILAQRFSVFFTPKSFNTKLSVAQAINRGYQQQQVAILEYAAYTKGEIKTLAHYFQPDLAVVTGLTEQHLGLFGSLDNIILAKSELVKATKRKIAFYHGADPGAYQICQAGKPKTLIDYSGQKNQLPLSSIKLNAAGFLSFSYEGELITTQLIGEQYLDALRAAITIATYLKLTSAQIIKGLKTFTPPDFFIQRRTGFQGCTVIDDGDTCNPKGFQAALKILLATKDNYDRVILVTAGIVDLGELSHQLHQQLAGQTKAVVNEVWYLGNDGQIEFSAAVKNNFTTRDSILERLQTINQSTLLLLEGKIPAWLENKILNYGTNL